MKNKIILSIILIFVIGFGFIKIQESNTITFENNHIKTAVLNSLEIKNTAEATLSKKDLINVTKLNINLNKTKDNNLSEINDLKYLKNLEYLNISNNNITQIADLATLDSIKVVYANNNKLETIKPFINLKNLEVLCLDDNNIKDITGISELKNLKQLYISNNQIENLEELNNLNNLEIIDIEGLNIKDYAKLNLDIKSKIINYKKQNILKSIRIASNDDYYSNTKIYLIKNDDKDFSNLDVEIKSFGEQSELTKVDNSKDNELKIYYSSTNKDDSAVQYKSNYSVYVIKEDSKIDFNILKS
ncbi:leucine-rich repeat domain-containing protein [Peptostreptococcaceae bacterium AGR-M142]